MTVLRVFLYAQVVLGVGRFAGLIRSDAVWRAHLVLAFVIALLALVLLRPRPGGASPGLRAVARFSPLAALATGLAIYFGLAGGALTLLHVLLGLSVVGVIEAAAGREGEAGAGSAPGSPARAPGGPPGSGGQ